MVGLRPLGWRINCYLSELFGQTTEVSSTCLIRIDIKQVNYSGLK
jgi:hypothetical protein